MHPERWQRIEDLYHDALNRDASLRAEFLDQECGDDEDLRQELLSLLRADECEDFLEQPLGMAAAPLLSSAERRPARLAPGLRLGPYEVRSPIAAGGMGEVYSALDVRLDRVVAIKTLPSHLADRRDLRERFEREARTISNLNHPHICTLHDIGHENGIDFMVMEYLDGETLARRLCKGALPTSEVLRIALQIADALDKAHRRGIVHRDLKPGNIMLTKMGAKLLDFGVAKQVRQPQPPASPAPPTECSPAADMLTSDPALLGTVQYMAPEQRHRDVTDARTDIFAFGAVVHEMLTGRKALERTGEPSIAQGPAASQQTVTAESSSQALLAHLIKTCLAKEPDDRWQAMADVLIQLQLIADLETGLVPIAAGEKSSRVPRIARTAAYILFIGTVALFAGSFSRMRKPETSKISVEIPTPPAPSTLDIALSATGSHVAAIVGERGEDMLWMRPLEHLKAQTVSGTQGAGLPFWSPDGRSIGFFAEGKLKKVGLLGAPPQTISDAVSGRGGAWSANNVIVFAPAADGALFRVDAGGGVAVAVTELDRRREERAHRHPQFLPDGEHFLYLVLSRKPENSGIFIGSLNSSFRKFLVNATAKAVFAPPDRLLYVRSGTLVSQQFDLKRLELNGEPVPLTQDVGTNVVTNSADFTVSANGTLAYRGGGSGGNTYLLQFDRAGKEIRRLGTLASYESPDLSADLHRLAVARVDGSAKNIWILDIVRGALTRFTFGRGLGYSAVVVA
jgi:eukaryotic-like serine/threonine-protein kinase